jgi:hypothetical protein
MRTAGTFLIGLAILWTSSVANAQGALLRPGGPFRVAREPGSTPFLPVDRKSGATLATVKAAIADKDWVKAARLLQELLDKPVDLLAPLVDKEEAKDYTLVRAEVLSPS